ncbi:MAG: cytochrome c family protein [Pseudomonadota bacterium]
MRDAPIGLAPRETHDYGAHGMTQDTTSESTPEANANQGDLFNTAAGWVLFAGIVGLGLSVVSGMYFHGNSPDRPEQLGYVIEGVEEEGGVVAAEMTMAEALNMESVDVSAGEKVYAKCSSCHSIEAGGANGIGPNLHGIMGSSVGKKAGYQYSEVMAGFGGNWGWDEMNQWLKSPKRYMDGTKMGFAGLSKVEDRAAVALYMNSQGSNLPVPDFVAAAAETDEVADAEAEAATDAVETAEDAQNAAEETSEETAAAEE